MDLVISFPGGKRVNAQFGGHVVETDQPLDMGGTQLAPPPFELFLASLGTCAGYYVMAFCQARQISMTGIQMLQKTEYDENTKALKTVTIELKLPSDFPEKYRTAVKLAAESCKVKKVLAHPPEVCVQLV